MESVSDLESSDFSKKKSARYFRDFFAAFFLYICCQFLVNLKPFLTENEKTQAILQIGINVAHLFDFINFFPFW